MTKQQVAKSKGAKKAKGRGDKANCTPPANNSGKQKSAYKRECEEAHMRKKDRQNGYSDVMRLIQSDLRKSGIKA